MPRTRTVLIAGAVAVSSAVVLAQTVRQSGAAGRATDVTAADVKAAVAKGLQALVPGKTVSDHNFSVADAGDYQVAVGFVARPSGAAGANARAISHTSITEVYYILKGSGTQVTGKLVDPQSEAGSPDTGPGMSSTKPLSESRISRLGPGDIQVIPPGVGHVWSLVDQGGIEYLVFRVDPAGVVGVSNP